MRILCWSVCACSRASIMFLATPTLTNMWLILVIIRPLFMRSLISHLLGLRLMLLLQPLSLISCLQFIRLITLPVLWLLLASFLLVCESTYLTSCFRAPPTTCVGVFLHFFESVWFCFSLKLHDTWTIQVHEKLPLRVLQSCGRNNPWYTVTS